MTADAQALAHAAEFARAVLGDEIASARLTIPMRGALLVVAVGKSQVATTEVQRVADDIGVPLVSERAQSWVSRAIAEGLVGIVRGRLRMQGDALGIAVRAGLGAVNFARAAAQPSARRLPAATRPTTATRPAATRRAGTPIGSTPTVPSAAKPTAALAPAPAWRPAPRVNAILDPAAIAEQIAVGQTSLAAVRHALEAHALAAAASFDELMSLPTLSGITSHRYQIETVRRLLRALGGRALLADEVGLGKTIEAIIALREYQIRGMARRILVLTPAALVHHWVGELSAKAGIEACSTDDPRVRTDPDAFWATGGVVVASLGTARTTRHAPVVAKQAWDLVIVDEAHHIKRRTSLGWKLVDALRSRFLLLLTATPIESDLDEIYSLITLLRPGHFATPAAFRAQFVDAKNPSSPRNREQLRSLLGQVMIRNTRAGCGLGLPPRFVTTYAVEPLAEEQQLYDATLALLRASAGDASLRRLANVLVLEAGSSPAAVIATLERALERRGADDPLAPTLHALQDAARAARDMRKRSALLEILALHPGEQILVFTRYRNTARYIADALAEAAIDHVVFEGGLAATERAHVLSAFADGTRVMVATDVGGEGQNLQFCHVLVDFDLPWNPMLVEQRIGRLHRMGQTSEVRVYNLSTRGTIDDRLLDVLDRRLALFELVVGEMDMVLGNLADERDLEERVLALAAESGSEIELDAGFTAIEQELRAARGRYEHTRALDEALFGEDFES